MSSVENHRRRATATKICFALVIGVFVIAGILSFVRVGCQSTEFSVGGDLSLFQWDQAWLRVSAELESARSAGSSSPARGDDEEAGDHGHHLGAIRSLARLAQSNGVAYVDHASSEWQARSSLAWNRVVELEPNDTEANIALGRKMFDGHYVDRSAIPVLVSRQRRRNELEMLILTAKTPSERGPDGLLERAGQSHASLAVRGVTVDSTLGQADLSLNASRIQFAFRYLEQVWAVPNSVLQQLAVRRIYIVKDSADANRLLASVSSGRLNEIVYSVDSCALAWRLKPDTYLVAGSESITGAAVLMSVICRETVAALSQQQSLRVESCEPDWIWVGMGLVMSVQYDEAMSSLVRETRLTGSPVYDAATSEWWIRQVSQLVRTVDQLDFDQLAMSTMREGNFSEARIAESASLIRFALETDAAGAQKRLRSRYEGEASAIDIRAQWCGAVADMTPTSPTSRLHEWLVSTWVNPRPK